MEEKQSFLKQKIDLESPNKNIVPITTSIGGDGKLSVGGCSIEELVKKYDSPLYILDEITLRNSCRAYKKALEKYYPGKSLPIYASKANSSIFMSNLVSSEGLGLDAVSEGELLTALKGGVPNEKIVFHFEFYYSHLLALGLPLQALLKKPFLLDIFDWWVYLLRYL